MPPLRALLLLLMLGACVPAARRLPRVPPAPPRQTPVGRPPAGPDPAALRQCVARLDRSVRRYALLPDRVFSPGCAALGAVQLRDIGTPVANLGAMTCPLADAFVAWVQRDVQPSAIAAFGQPVARIESLGTYSCRNVNGAASGRLSEHAQANAVDIAAFVLADGRRVTVREGWNGEPADAAFLRAVRAAACRRFATVLSPDYNGYHRDHLHFDMGRGPFCR